MMPAKLLLSSCVSKKGKESSDEEGGVRSSPHAGAGYRRRASRSAEVSGRAVREIPEVILPRRITEKEILEIVKRKSRPN